MSGSIYYTTDGSTPTCSSTLYTGAITVSSTETIQAIACSGGEPSSTVASATYNIGSIVHVQSTGATSGAGAVASESALFISPTTAGNLIVVGVNGYGSATATFTVTDTSGNTYSQAGIYATNGLNRTAIFYAKSIAGGYDTVTVAASPSVELTFGIHEYSGADPSAPLVSTATGTGSSAAGLTGTVMVGGANEMLFAAFGTEAASGGFSITVGSGDTSRYVDSGLGQAALLDEDKIGVSTAGSMTDSYGYSVGWAGVAASFTPSAFTFSPVANNYGSPQSVTITAGASVSGSIYYTTNGSTPTCSSTLYTGAITVSSTETIEAIACSGGEPTSIVASATYTIGSIAHVQSIGATSGGTSVASQSALFISPTTAGNLIVVGVNGYGSATATFTVTDTSGNTYSQAGIYATNGTNRTAIFYAKNIAGGYDTVTVTASSSVELTFGIHEYSGADPSAPLVSTSSGTGTSAAGLTGTVTVGGANEMLFAAFGTEAASGGFSITVGSGDTSRYVDSGLGQAALLDEDKIGVSTAGSMTDSYGYSVGWAGVAASFAPQAIWFSPAGGNFINTQSVTMSTGASGSIYYTTDGSTPTCSSTLYTGAITVSSTETIQAIACSGGVPSSTIVSATYTNTIGNWTRAQRLAITVPSGTTSGLSYFPVLITAASLPTELTNNTYGMSNGGDLAFATDSSGSIGSQIPCEVVSASFGGSPSAEIYVQVPSVAATGTTTYIWVLYGNSSQTTQPSATSTYGRNAVWNENGTQNFVGVWHFGTPSTWSGTDSTGLGNNLTNSGTTAGTGNIGGAQQGASGAYSYNNSPVSLPSGTSARTYSMFFKLTSSSSNQALGGWGLNSTNGDRWDMWYQTNTFEMEVENSGATASHTYDTNWHEATFTNASGNGNNSSIGIYIDGSSATNTGSGTFSTTASPDLVFGGIPGAATTDNSTALIDEARISVVARSASWIAAEYANFNAPSTFVTTSGSPITP